MDKLEAIALGGAACIGGVGGFFYATFLTATEIVAVSTPVGIVAGALAFVGYGLSVMEGKSDD